MTLRAIIAALVWDLRGQDKGIAKWEARRAAGRSTIDLDALVVLRCALFALGIAVAWTLPAVIFGGGR